MLQNNHSQNIHIKGVIFTDLDDSLLKNNKFDQIILDKFIKKLVLDGFHLTIITSKTLAEVKSLYKNSSIYFPFSTENGSSFYIPDSKFKNKYKFKKTINSKAVVSNEIKKKLDLLPTKLRQSFIYLKDLEVKEQLKLTKLKKNQLMDFYKRDFSISLIWIGNKETFEKFNNFIKSLSLRAIFGGKMINISGIHNKLDAVKFFEKYYTAYKKQKTLKTISIGDSENDIEMLNYCDYSGIVKREDKTKIQLNKDHDVFISKNLAPVGWTELINLIKNKMEK